MLIPPDARRAARGVETVIEHGLRPALAGSLARALQLRALGRVRAPRRLNDVDLIVENFGALPASLAGSFLLNHLHPAAAEGQVLVQLIDESLALRIDVFRAFGRSLSRAVDVRSTVALRADGSRNDHAVAPVTAISSGRALEGSRARAAAQWTLDADQRQGRVSWQVTAPSVR